MIRKRCFLSILAAAVLLACGFSGFAAGSKGQLYYLQFDMINGFNIGSGIYMEKFAKEFGYDIKLLNAQGSSDTQINQMDTVIALKPKAIIVKPVDAGHDRRERAEGESRGASGPVLRRHHNGHRPRFSLGRRHRKDGGDGGGRMREKSSRKNTDRRRVKCSR